VPSADSHGAKVLMNFHRSISMIVVLQDDLAYVRSTVPCRRS
jgi:hypothetical protein